MKETQLKLVKIIFIDTYHLQSKSSLERKKIYKKNVDIFFFFTFGRHSEYFAQFSMSTVMQNFHAILKPYKIEGTFQKRHFGIFSYF